ncbi:MAG: VOC family protein [Chitinophagaceae bacterium]|jgi:catechol 2,3-dioxygenase-like lactoylglutathione lyase family enzyme|nr:VOC family protein [Sphingobacteriales bacterium]OJW05167.1 MAG: glyoxalase [Sphingobacteriales bacterium 44-61]TXJ26016.1 MAG: VOC family protein [Chitinophagaceae bacterium]
MITKLSHTTLFVLDQEKAYDFYVNKLGFKVNTDATMGNGYRWLTVNPPDQPDLEVVLMAVLHESMVKSDACPDGLDQESRDAFKVLLEKGIMGAGVMHTNDCRATYEELKAKGVQFKGEPREQFYGIEAVMFDGCGNWFSVTQPKEM